MTIDQIEPAIGEEYRRRDNSQVMILRIYRADRNVVILKSEQGEWVGTVQDFWETFIHARASNK